MTKKYNDPNYNPNVHPWKVFVVDKDGNEMQVRTYTKQEKAINYCIDKGNKGDKRVYRVRKVVI
jgi:hypothetical protein